MTSTFTYVGTAKDLLAHLQDNENVFQHAMTYLERKGSDFMRVHWYKDADLMWYEFEDERGFTQTEDLPEIYTEAFLVYA